MNHPSLLRKYMKPGTVWTRVNHQHPSQVGGELIAEKGQPVKVRVHAVTKEGVELEIMDKPGTISYLTWPDPLIMWMTTEPNKITIENRWGPILTYTRDMTEARSVIEVETPKGIFKAAVGGEPVAYDVKWVDTAGQERTSRFTATSPEDAIDTLHFGYAYVKDVLSVTPVSRSVYQDYHQKAFGRPWDEHPDPNEPWPEDTVKENIDSYEGGVPRPVNPFKDQIDRLLKGPDYEPELRYDYHPTDPKFKEQLPPPEPKWHPGHRSARMSMNRNTRRKSFGYRDTYSLRDRGWPYANRGFDRRRKAWEKAVARFGQVRGEGEGI